MKTSVRQLAENVADLEKQVKELKVQLDLAIQRISWLQFRPLSPQPVPNYPYHPLPLRPYDQKPWFPPIVWC